MSFKSATQPLCRYCGKPIPKHTTTTYFHSIMTGGRTETPTSKAEVERLTNLRCVALRWSRKGDFYADKVGHDFIYQASMWDGESYTDEYFCRQPCAVYFAYLLAENGKCTIAYSDEMAKRSPYREGMPT